ncbi:hypothetical protein CL89_gp317 [Aeromonas phage PX29]|uniref:Uncharacterized protein n=1 Tax=Aeromonas phage PX29 TaxID=926067 RepID=E5DQ94_9CAUD|nr:hypothetical protein CL89_gp317 [Aeromonas phage PX29]ADQ52880.1 conserved hypothetical protein [Aeromonas phage PX29]
MARTTRVKNKNEVKYLIGHNFWKANCNAYYRIGKYDFWRYHIQQERINMNVYEEYDREKNQIVRGYDCEVCKTGNYSNKSCREYANLSRAKVRDQLKAITLENSDCADIIDDRKQRTCTFRWIVQW